MRVLLLGGTGAIGSHLAAILSKRGIDVNVTSRSKRIDSESISFHQLDAQNLDELKPLLNQTWDVIVDFMVYSTNQFKNRVETLLNASSQYVFISSGRVYANTSGLLVEESTRLIDSSDDAGFLATYEYSLTKARQEDILKTFPGKKWTIVRPYITYSESRLQLGVLEKEEWLYRALKGRTIVFSEDIIKKITTLTYGFDVSNAIAKLIGKPKALCNTFHISINSEFSMKWEDILTIYSKVLEKHLGYKPKVLLLGLNNFLKFRDKSVYQIIYDRLYDRKFDTSKIEEFIKVEEFLDPEKGLEHCLTKFLEEPKFKRINWKQEARRDKYAKEWTPLKEITEIKSKLKYLYFRCC